MSAINKTGDVNWDKLGLGAPAETKSQNLEQDQFLQLMVAQLQNQDPFKPMESGEYLTQIAQFGTVSGIKDLQQSFDSLSTSLQSSQALQASSLVGRSVLIASEHLALGANGEMRGAFELEEDADQVTLNFYDTAGQLVRRVALGEQAAGLVQFNWDGVDTTGTQLPAGLYRVGAEATVSGRTGSVEVLANSHVESVTVGRSGRGLTLNLSDQGSRSLADVRHIL